MPRDYTSLPRTQIRRSDRAVNDEAWMKALLQRAPLESFRLSMTDNLS
ncbi:hypothetical protein [Ktedonospora formicarum]|nr:hypothetical protein [Ktedonospora formicarum]